MSEIPDPTVEPCAAPSTSSIIRAGADGRLRLPAAARAELLEAYDRSGMTAMAFARLHGLKYPTFIACDMRKSFDGLHAEVLARLGEDPRGGAVFGFTNRRRTIIKLVHWDGTGLWVHAKRLEAGKYRWPKTTDAKDGKIRLEPTALAMLTDGIDLRDGARRAWYERQ